MKRHDIFIAFLWLLLFAEVVAIGYGLSTR
jgi:hypothetical protein